MNRYTHSEAAVVLRTTPAAVRKLQFLGYIPEHNGKRRWSERQLLAMLVLLAARNSGADLRATRAAVAMFSGCDLDSVRAACDAGKRYLRLMGGVADDQLVTEAAAFHDKLLRAATETQTPLVVIDIKRLLNRIDEAKLIAEPVEETFHEGAAV